MLIIQLIVASENVSDENELFMKNHLKKQKQWSKSERNKEKKSKDKQKVKKMI